MQTAKKIVFELQNVMSQFKRTMALQHNHTKLKGAEKHILFLIYELKSGQPVTMSEIAEKTCVTLAAVTHQINAMEKQGLLNRLSDKNDRRVTLIELTKKGQVQVLKLKNEFTKKTQMLVNFLGEKDTKDLIRLIKKMSDFRGCVK